MLHVEPFDMESVKFIMSKNVKFGTEVLTFDIPYEF